MNDITIQDLFYLRDEEYSIQTKEILKMLSLTLDAINEFLGDEIVNRLVWTDVLWMKPEEVIIVVGNVNTLPGETITTETGTIIITEETAQVLKRVIRIGLSLDLIKQNSKDEIINFLKTTHSSTHKDLISESKDAIDNIVFEDETGDLMNISFEPDEESFNTSELSDDQIEQLIQEERKNKRSIH